MKNSQQQRQRRALVHPLAGDAPGSSRRWQLIALAMLPTVLGACSGDALGEEQSLEQGRTKDLALTSARAGLTATSAAGYDFVPADYDGDGMTDVAVKTLGGSWRIDFASNGFGAWDWSADGYGFGDVQPVPADYTGDGAADVAIYLPTGEWYIDDLTTGPGWDYKYMGPDTGIPVPADYDGDGITDLAVYAPPACCDTTNPATWNVWWIDYSRNGFGDGNPDVRAQPAPFGRAPWHPVPADYDGDGRADLATRDGDGMWRIDFAANGFGLWERQWGGYGLEDAHPVPADYTGDGVADLAIKGDAGGWYVDDISQDVPGWDMMPEGFGGKNTHAVPADYDGDGLADFALARDDGWLFIDYTSTGRGGWDYVHGLFDSSGPL